MSEQPAAATDQGAALLAMYDGALPSVYGYLLARCGKASLAEELTSETFLGAVDAIKDGGLLFAYYEYVGTDHDADMAAMAEDDQTRAWWELTGPCQHPVEGAGPEEWWAAMEEVFHVD